MILINLYYVLSRSQFRASKQLHAQALELTVVMPRETTSGRQTTTTRSRTELRSTIKSRYHITYSARPARVSNARHYIDEQRCRGGVERRNWSTSHCRQHVTSVVRNIAVRRQHRTSCVKQCYSICAYILYSIVYTLKRKVQYTCILCAYCTQPSKGTQYTCIVYMYSIHI